MVKKTIGKNNRNSEQDRFTVVLESIQSDFQVFGEKLDLMDEKFERRFNGVDNRLDKIELRLDRIEAELVGIKLEISDLKTKLDKKVDIERLESLEKRVKQIEIILSKK